MPQVKIGPSFFAKVKSDYRNWRSAIAREFLQNCCDAPGTTKVEVRIEEQGGQVQLVVKNDGRPMTEEILVNKLLALGESGKDFAGTVGGFGRAKEILYFTHLRYQIHSGPHMVQGSGGEYELTRDAHFHGTKSYVYLENEDDLASELEEEFRKLILMTQRPHITFTVNGEVLPGNLKKGSRRREFTWGTVYTNKAFENRLIVRIDGMPMFTKYVDLDRCVVVELTGNSGKALQSNRDGLNYRYQDQLDEFIRQLSVNKTNALEEQEPVYTHYEGDKLAAKAATSATMKELIEAAYANVQERLPPEPVVAEGDGDTNEDYTEEADTLEVDEPADLEERDEYEPVRIEAERPKRSPIRHEFLIKNCLGMAIPAHLLPESFSAYSKRLIKLWASTLMEIHRLYGYKGDFAIGFILDEHREAEFERSSDYGVVYYINPIVIRRNSFGGRAMARRWKFSPAGKYAILSVALHEYVHRILPGHGHDEDYAATLTELTGVLLTNLTKIRGCLA